jgi:tetratricopeptide (TPR) repeat protein
VAEDRWARIADLFEQARRRPAAERPAFVAGAAGGDASVAGEVLSLLQANDQAEGRYDSPTADDVERWFQAPEKDDWTGRQIGDCRLTRRIAHGGMGVVYEAVQDPPGRKVAVKLLRTAVPSEALRQRFEWEARLLGNLQHPGIARVYEAGTYEDRAGEPVPYYVMEYVPEAWSLTDYASAKDLDLPARLRLFIRVLEAVHFGHQKGVIHRDLKPGNILVDVDGNPKVIDFGIARGQGPEFERTTPLTQTGQLMGTVPYMSPEQVLGSSDDLDTRSDVYALGVILYEMLTGRLPYDLDGLGIVEAAQTIRDRPPVPPSRLRPEVAGDVQLILLKALAKDPAQRYASAAEFASDLQRWLDHEPVHARPPSLYYQLRLLARRNRAAFVSAAAIVVALVAAVVVSGLFAVEAERARKAEALRAKEAEQARAREAEARTRAEERLGTLSETLLFLTDVTAVLPEGPRALGTRIFILREVRERLDRLAIGPDDDTGVLHAAARTWLRHGEAHFSSDGTGHTGDLAAAEDSFEQALSFFTVIAERRPEEALFRVERSHALGALGVLRVTQGEREEGLRLQREGIEVLEDAARRMGSTMARYDLVRAHESIAQSLNQVGEPGAALEHLEAAFDVGRTVAAAAPTDENRLMVARLHGSLASQLTGMGERDAAYPHLQAMLRGFDEVPHLVEERQRSMLLMQLGDHHALRLERDTAERYYLQTLEIDDLRAKEAPDDARRLDDLAITLGRLAAFYADGARLEEASNMWRRALDVHRTLLAASPDDQRRRDMMDRTLRGLAETLIFAGELPEAERLLGESLAIVERELAAAPDALEWRRAAPQTHGLMGKLRQAQAATEPDGARRVRRLREAEALLTRSLDLYATLVVEGTSAPWMDYAIRDLETRRTAVRTALAVEGG